MNKSCLFRIIHINDVYTLGNLPSLATLIREKSEGPDCTIAVPAGDFVAPSLLSALDMDDNGVIDRREYERFLTNYTPSSIFLPHRQSLV